MDLILHADRRFFAAQSSAAMFTASANHAEDGTEGYLFYTYIKIDPYIDI
jgi:hypothetical protein